MLCCIELTSLFPGFFCTVGLVSLSGETFVILTMSFTQDPLNSGDDVSEQDVPDLFDTDNVVVCQYDKVGGAI